MGSKPDRPLPHKPHKPFLTIYDFSFTPAFVFAGDFQTTAVHYSNHLDSILQLLVFNTPSLTVLLDCVSLQSNCATTFNYLHRPGLVTLTAGGDAHTTERGRNTYLHQQEREKDEGEEREATVLHRGATMIRSHPGHIIIPRPCLGMPRTKKHHIPGEPRMNDNGHVVEESIYLNL